MILRFTINYIFFWSIWNWKITLTLYWIDQYLEESTIHSTLFQYLTDILPDALYIRPATTAFICMILIPIIDNTIRKYNNWVNNLIKKN